MEKENATTHEPNHLNGFQCAAVSENDPYDLSIHEKLLIMGINSEKDSSKSNLSSLLKVFQDIYDQRLSAIENNNNMNEPEKNAEKLHVLQQYIEQLQEQNDTFVLTMTELETEAQQRVVQMEKRLKSSAKTTMEAAININECEKEMRRLVKERLYIESLYNDMQQHLSSLKVENGFLCDQNFNLSHDVQALLHIINHARSTGHWEMDCVTFCEVTPEQVFGPVQSISSTHLPDTSTELHPFGSEKNAAVIDVASHCTSDSNLSSPAIAPYARMQSKCPSEDNFYENDIHNEILDKNKRIACLEAQLSEVQQQLSMKEAECECHLWKMEMLVQQQKNRVHNFTSELQVSNTLSKCISLPDIGNIYHFGNPVRKSRSYDNCGNMQEFGFKFCSKKCNEGINSQLEERNNFERCSTVHKVHDKKSCINRGQSEPRLFMLGNNIYVYRPCESIKKTSNVALQDDYESSLPPSQSIDLKFPIDESNNKLSDWTASDRKDLYNVSESSFCKEYEMSSCSCSDSEVDSLDKESFSRCRTQVSAFVQTEKPKTYSIGLQTIVKRVESENAAVKENGSLEVDTSQMFNTIQLLKENLVKAEDKAQSKEILLSQLQGHLISSVKEVELKDTALQNLEKKLDLSRSECSSLKHQINELNSEIQQILQEVEDGKVVNENLKLKAKVREEEFEDMTSQIKMLQEQKRALMIQLDAQGDDLEDTKEEFQKMQQKAESTILQVEQQSQIIKNLQDALVQAKRAFDATQQRLPNSHSVSSNYLNETKSSSKLSIVDI